ncbi:hypothetical protein PAEPH01_1668 [Pancytospora epiphaga]|nr:hypothetical protein PAEPH01_1668 [Pancytospora epiphaga]
MESKSTWRSNIVPVSKDTNKVRVCIDFRPLNGVTIKDTYPISRIDEILDQLAGATIFSSLDATSGYFQIALNPEDAPKTAFVWKGRLLEFTRMSFGLCNAPATFQRAMIQILRREIGNCALMYFDDTIVYSKTLTDHVEHLRTVFWKLRAAGISFNPSKCHVGKLSLKFLDHLISSGSVRPDQRKLSAIQEYHRPSNIKELRFFLGLCNYSRNFISHYAD